MSPLFLFTLLIPEIIVHDVSLYYQSRAHIYVRVFIYSGLEVKQNQTSHFFAALTLLNELLMIIEQQTIGFIFIFAA